MQVTITIHCPHCQSAKIVNNGKKANSKQNCYCQNCNKQFIADYQRTYKGAYPAINKRIGKMLVRGCGDIADIEDCSTAKVLGVFMFFAGLLKPKRQPYDRLEVDEFWTYVGKKASKRWLLYAYDPRDSEVVAWVWGKRDMRTVKSLCAKMRALGLIYSRIGHDCWQAFKTVFAGSGQDVGKTYTKGIEGNNCRLRHRIRRVFRRTCCFSKKLSHHIKAFELAFFYLNYGHV